MNEFVDRVEFESQLAALRHRVEAVTEIANIASLTAAQAARDCELLVVQQRRLWSILRPLVSSGQIELLDRERRAGVVEAVVSEDVRDHVVEVGVPIPAALAGDVRARMSQLKAAVAEVGRVPEFGCGMSPDGAIDLGEKFVG